MKRHITAIVAILSCTLVADVRAEEIPVFGLITGIGEVVEEGPPILVTPSLNLVSRGFVAYELTTGDFAPQILVSSTFILDILSGEGMLFGHIEWEDRENPGSGFRGPLMGDVSGAFAPGLGGFDGSWNLRGYGIYQGATADIDNYGPFSGNQVYEGGDSHS
jgi:hypothetical protein